MMITDYCNTEGKLSLSLLQCYDWRFAVIQINEEILKPYGIAAFSS